MGQAFLMGQSGGGSLTKIYTWSFNSGSEQLAPPWPLERFESVHILPESYQTVYNPAYGRYDKLYWPDTVLKIGQSVSVKYTSGYKWTRTMILDSSSCLRNFKTDNGNTDSGVIYLEFKLK